MTTEKHVTEVEQRAKNLSTRIDETHDGTKNDPIPKRIGAQAGDKIILQYLPHELVGQYFEVIE